MKKRAIIIHGYTGHPEKNWFPWLKRELETKGFEVSVPAMPHANAPQLSEWLPTLQSVISEPDEETYLIGHSLGGITILRYLETMKENQKIGGALLVAGFSRPIHFTELNNFFGTPLDYEKCRRSARSIVCINSDNDEHVPLEDGEIMRDKLSAKLIVVPNAGHLNQKSGYAQLPLAFKELLVMAGIKFKGVLLKESLADETVLDLLKITKIEKWDVSNATKNQPKVWHAMWYEGESSQADKIADVLSKALKQGEWYTNFRAEDQVYVIFPRKVFVYTRGDETRREEAKEYGRSIQLDESQLDWTE